MNKIKVEKLGEKSLSSRLTEKNKGGKTIYEWMENCLPTN